MRMRVIAPRPELRDRVRAFLVVENDGGPVLALPGAGAVFGFQIGGRIQSDGGVLAPAGISGTHTKAREFVYQATRSLLVRLTPQGAGSLGVPAAHLVDRTVALDELMKPATARILRERVLAARSWGDRIAIVEEFLLGFPFAPDPLVERSMRRLERVGCPRVAVVAREHSMSERHFERRFLAAVGVSPKRFARLRRFERAVRTIGAAGALAAAAHDAGYADQAHLTRDFRDFTGMSPGEYLRRQ
jgi:AraC-like DNA-binding protein